MHVHVKTVLIVVAWSKPHRCRLIVNLPKQMLKECDHVVTLDDFSFH